MAKRFTDTAKWEKAWFRRLEPVNKCIWMFLCDRCDHAGIWDIDPEAFQYFIGADCSVASIIEVFGDRIRRVDDDKLLIVPFASYQYGHLNPENRVHKSVIDRLKKLENKDLSSPLQGAKDKDKETDTDKEAKLNSKKLPRLAELWNEHVPSLARVTKSNASRTKRANELFKENTEPEWAEILKRIHASRWCHGENPDKWKATFNWLLYKETHLKVSEGTYDNRSGQAKPGSASDSFCGIAEDV